MPVAVGSPSQGRAPIVFRHLRLRRKHHVGGAVGPGAELQARHVDVTAVRVTSCRAPPPARAKVVGDVDATDGVVDAGVIRGWRRGGERLERSSGAEGRLALCPFGKGTCRNFCLMERAACERLNRKTKWGVAVGSLLCCHCRCRRRHRRRCRRRCRRRRRCCRRPPLPPPPSPLPPQVDVTAAASMRVVIIWWEHSTVTSTRKQSTL